LAPTREDSPTAVQDDALGYDFDVHIVSGSSLAIQPRIRLSNAPVLAWRHRQ